MALQTLNTPLNLQGLSDIVGTPSITTDALLPLVDAAGEYAALVLVARDAMVISHVGWRVGAATDAPTADVRIETVDAAGLPSGTLWAPNTNVVTGALSVGWGLYALTAPATIAAGQLFAVKFAYNSGTSFRMSIVTVARTRSGLPFVVTNTGAVTKSTLIYGVCLALGSSATAFYHLPWLYPVNSTTFSAFNNTNAAERGLRFKVPFKCRCVGIKSAVSEVGNFNIVLRDDAGAELSNSSTAYDGDHARPSTADPRTLYFDNPVTLNADTWYRATIQPTSATNTNINTFTLPSADYRSGAPGGLNNHYTTFASGSWTDSATDQLPLLDILIDQLDDGISAGAGNPIGMVGAI